MPCRSNPYSSVRTYVRARAVLIANCHLVGRTALLASAIEAPSDKKRPGSPEPTPVDHADRDDASVSVVATVCERWAGATPFQGKLTAPNATVDAQRSVAGPYQNYPFGWRDCSLARPSSASILVRLVWSPPLCPPPARCANLSLPPSRSVGGWNCTFGCRRTSGQEQVFFFFSLIGPAEPETNRFIII
jgi:hypothetical protein